MAVNSVLAHPAFLISVSLLTLRPPTTLALPHSKYSVFLPIAIMYLTRFTHSLAILIPLLPRFVPFFSD